ncbi:MAG: sigma-70 family RNA polymerase sigma factor [Acidobacteria bacterium]|nr:sigma-70 family RNA polymerase sigma factor [Acidobacteriota bacterium]
MTAREEVTHLLQAWCGGSVEARDKLMPLVYRELRELARSCLRRERPGHTLQATALVHEAYLRLVKEDLPSFQVRSHFFGIAARAMRQILIEHARARGAAKRGGGAKLSLEEIATVAGTQDPDILDLDQALDRLSALDARKSRIVELRYFGGLTVEEIAEMEELSPATVGRDLRFAESWLRREMGGGATA